jgi:hypothetical protein
VGYVNNELEYIGQHFPRPPESVTIEWRVTTITTAVFLSEQAAWFDDATLQTLLKQAGIDLGGSVTIKRGTTHAFVNFGFEAT